MAMRLSGATELAPWQLPGLQRMVARLARRAGIEAPRLYLVQSPEPNAFTTGSAVDGSALAVTHGALDILSRDEIEGVLAHEVAHIRNRDTTLLRLAGTTSHAMTLLLGVSLWLTLPIALIGGLTPSSLLLLVGLAIVVPMVVTLMVAALSRTRELAADADGVALTGKPLALASALSKLERQRGWLGAFFLRRADQVPELLRSHPSTEERVERLLAMSRATPSYVSRLPRRRVLQPGFYDLG
jgi:heat shock protein HtpX